MSIKLAKPITKDDVTAVAILPYLWLDGTKQLPSAKALTRRMETLYGAGVRTAIGKRGDMHVAEINAGIPQDAYFQTEGPLLTAVLQLASELIGQPAVADDAFLSQHVRLEKAQHAERIARIFDDKMAYAMERCLAETYAGTNVGLPRLGFAEDIDTLDGRRLYEVHQLLQKGASVNIYLSGDLGNLDAVQSAVQAAFEPLFATEAGARQSQREVAPLSPTRTEAQAVTEAQPIQQGKLNLSYRTGVSYRDELYPALLTASGVLGGFPHSKLFQNVREKASLAYYAYSRVDALTGVLTIQTGIDVRRYEQALEIIRQQVASLKAGEISDEELAFTKRGIVNQYQQAADQPATVAELHYTGVLSGKTRPIEELIRSGRTSVNKTLWQQPSGFSQTQFTS